MKENEPLHLVSSIYLYLFTLFSMEKLVAMRDNWDMYIIPKYSHTMINLNSLNTLVVQKFSEDSL